MDNNFRCRFSWHFKGYNWSFDRSDLVENKIFLSVFIILHRNDQCDMISSSV